MDEADRDALTGRAAFELMRQLSEIRDHLTHTELRTGARIINSHGHFVVLDSRALDPGDSKHLQTVRRRPAD
jgi:hypothetical protein